MSKRLTIYETTPVATKPSAITNNDITVIKPGFEKLNISSLNEGRLLSGNKSCNIISADNKVIDTVSRGYLSETKKPRAIIPIIIIIRETKCSSISLGNTLKYICYSMVVFSRKYINMLLYGIIL